MVFSTAVEPNSSDNNHLKMLLSIKIGDGILTNKSCIYYGNPDIGFKIIYSDEKDCLPFGFQFGNISFPSGSFPNDDHIIFYGAGLKNIDGCSISFKINN
jgi:hypothetical protein